MKNTLAILLLACLITPARAQRAPLVYATVSEGRLAPGMLFELRVVTEGTASAVTLDLPGAIFQRGPATSVLEWRVVLPLVVRSSAQIVPDGPHKPHHEQEQRKGEKKEWGHTLHALQCP